MQARSAIPNHQHVSCPLKRILSQPQPCNAVAVQHKCCLSRSSLKPIVGLGVNASHVPPDTQDCPAVAIAIALGASEGPDSEKTVRTCLPSHTCTQKPALLSNNTHQGPKREPELTPEQSRPSSHTSACGRPAPRLHGCCSKATGLTARGRSKNPSSAAPLHQALHHKPSSSHTPTDAQHCGRAAPALASVCGQANIP